ncbi:MAG: hypothetical protein ACAH06_10570 [Methylophilaceae bacterium]|jgi:hypothetical protein
MRNSSFLVATSVVAAFLACNPAAADDSATLSAEHLHVGGYASGGFRVHPGGKAAADLHELSLILNWDGGGKLRLFSELEVETPLTWEEGGSISSNDADFDIERLYADYSLTGALTMRGGRLLTPVGRWNVTHAAPLVWTTNRPAATEKLFPEAINGVMLYGTLPLNEGALDYALFGEALRDQTKDKDEPFFEKTRGVRLAYIGIAEVGMTLSEFEEDAIGQPRYRMLGLDFFKALNGWEFSGELYRRFARGNDDDRSGGGYAQVVAPLGNRWFAIGRLENLRLPDEGTTGRWLVGTAWRWKNNQIFKLEYVGGRDEHPDMPRGFAASYAILF